MEYEEARLQQYINGLLGQRAAPRVLEAGCGDHSYLTLPERAHIVGADISEEQLLKNSSVQEKILADIQTYVWPSASFDLIICWWVLEHLSMPEMALEKFVRAIKEDGFIVLAVPNVLSVKGLITKYTPHWFHVWVYKSLYGIKLAGSPGVPPFRTFLRFAISPLSLKRFAAANGLSVVYFRLFESEGTTRFRQQHSAINLALWMARLAIKALTLGRIDAGQTECIIVLQKPKDARKINARWPRPVGHVRQSTRRVRPAAQH
ncbi:MAG TPA: class I SAM-dependent methyltransferase [Ktedonobacterales bacterium]|nr:class I SAM-dependent methyltransferase [Ktedonobacterales bacterium]